MSWRNDKRVTLMNRGMETILAVTEMADLPGAYRLVRHERMIGTTRTKTFEQIYRERDEAYSEFEFLLVEAIQQPGEASEYVGDVVASFTTEEYETR